MSSQTRYRFFIAGVARSGTTLLQSMLGAHPDLFTPPELHLWDQLFFKQKAIRFFQVIPESKLAQVKKRFRAIDPKLPVRSGKIWYNSTSYTRWVIRNLDEAAALAGKTGWLEKTPLNLYYTRLIQKTTPQAMIVHMVRNPEANIASLLEAGKKYPGYFAQDSLGACIDRYVREIKISARALDRPNNFLVRYEELVENPEKVLKELCRKTGLEFHKDMLRYREKAREIIEPEEAWKQNNVKELAVSEKYKRLLTTSELELIREKTGDLPIIGKEER
ncbi:MAG: hypothetical protein Kow00127_17350 [Bacteroidales bacterium]